MVPKAALSYVSGSYSRAYLSFGTDKITEDGWMTILKEKNGGKTKYVASSF